jgi:hypothetical protein
MKFLDSIFQRVNLQKPQSDQRDIRDELVSPFNGQFSNIVLNTERKLVKLVKGNDEKIMKQSHVVFNIPQPVALPVAVFMCIIIAFPLLSIVWIILTFKKRGNHQFIIIVT